MSIVSYIIIFLFLIRLSITIRNAFSHPFIPSITRIKETPSLSILIRCDNDIRRISYVLDLMHKITYSNLEVIIGLYRSTDEITSLIINHASIDTRFKIVYIESCRKNWICDNWINYQLGRYAKGNYLLFLDPDVDLRSGILETLIAYMSRSEERRVGKEC